MEPSTPFQRAHPASRRPPRTLAEGAAFLYSLLALLGAWLFLMVIMAGAAAWYTSRPVFCNSCHIMEPYYKSWQESSHKDVTCVECHFPPGIGGKVRGKMLGLVQLLKYVTASAGPRPTAEIPDASCLRCGCHETRLLSGRVDFHGIPFDHTPHLQEGRRGKTLRCTSCHSQIVQGKHMTVTTTTCFLCHFKDQPFNEQLSACTHCHQIPKKEFDLGGGVKFTHELAFEKRRRLHELPRRPDPRQRRRAPRTLPLLPQPRGRPGEDRRSRLHAQQARHRAQGRLHPVPHAHPAHPTIPRSSSTPQPIASPATRTITRNRSICWKGATGAKTRSPAPESNLMVGVRIECRTCHSVRETSSTGTELCGAPRPCARCATTRPR